MTPFERPGGEAGYVELGGRAIRDALTDAGLELADVGQAVAGFVYGDTASGQAVIYELGMGGTPIINVNNACASGSTALFLARQAILSGLYECVLAVGFEQMVRGPLPDPVFTDRADPCRRWLDIAERHGRTPQTPWPGMYAVLAREYMSERGVAPETFAAIAVKARRHASKNPNAVFRELLTVEEVMASPMVDAPLTKVQCSRPTSGAAAVVLCSTAFAARRGLSAQVRIRGQSMVSDLGSGFKEPFSMIAMKGRGQFRRAVGAVYETTGVGPGDLDVVELHDCFTPAEFLLYEALGLTPEGTAERFVADGENTYGGTIVVNPSGGLLGKGHPLGATGLAQIAELSWQLRGMAGERQVEGARLALAHNSGVPGGCVVTLLEATRH